MEKILSQTGGGKQGRDTRAFREMLDDYAKSMASMKQSTRVASRE